MILSCRAGDGWINAYGSIDFAGGTAVHISAGCSALVCHHVLKHVEKERKLRLGLYRPSFDEVARKNADMGIIRDAIRGTLTVLGAGFFFKYICILLDSSQTCVCSFDS